MKTKEGKGDYLLCPACEEEWSYGWYNRLALAKFLVKVKQWRCRKCKDVWEIKSLPEKLRRIIEGK
jgi:hypothetical protein